MNKLTDIELDRLLLNYYYPQKKELINFSDEEHFQNLILKKIDDNDLNTDFISYLIEFTVITLTNNNINLNNVYNLVFCDIKFKKMAAIAVARDYPDIVSYTKRRG